MPTIPGVQFPCLYRPETAAELLTNPILGKLMLGFTAGLDMPVALEDRAKRYELFGDPKSRFCEFCRKIRSDEFGLDKVCKAWDKNLALVLLGEKPEEYPGQMSELAKPFQCHMQMIDLAEVIRLAGRRFAVLHGGQIKPTASNWRNQMRHRLVAVLPDRAESEINALLSLVENMKEDVLVAQRHEAFKNFARELETVLEQLYRQRRAASEEALLKAVLEFLTADGISDWPSWWNQLDQVLTELCAACRLSRIALLVGKSSAHPFEVELRSTCRGEKWGQGELKIGPYWEVIRHKPVTIDAQSWSKGFRDCLSVKPNEPCALTASTCKVGTSASLVPAVMVWVGEETNTPGTLEFLGKLMTEISGAVTRTCDKLKLNEVVNQFSAAAAYGAHDVKFPLHAAFQLAEKNRHALTRLNVQDPQLIANSEKLIEALKEAKNKATPLEKLALRDIQIQCVFKPLDMIPLIDRAVALAQSVGSDKGVSVKWIERPTSPAIISADETYLCTAVHAIFDNAVKYSFDRKEVRVFAHIDDGRFTLRVSDFGVGIPPEEEFRIFHFGKRAEIEDYYAGKTRKGKGLGLAIAYRIIKAHHGDLSVESIPSKGSLSETDHLSCEVSAYIKLPLGTTT